MLALAFLAGAGTACGSDADDPDDPGPPDPATAAVTHLAGLEPASGDPVPAGFRSARPDTGRVAVVPGPFDDRLAYERLTLHGGVVSGRLTVTSDVSDVLELEVVAGFYDDAGRLLGTATWVHHLDEATEPPHDGPPDESLHFRVVVPHRLRDRVDAAAVAVPVLVNE